MITTTAKAAISSMQRVEDVGEGFARLFAFQRGVIANAFVDTGPSPSLKFEFHFDS